MTNEKENTSLLLWDKQWFLAQREYLIRKAAKRLMLRLILENNREDINRLCKIFKIK